ncbi:MAG: hypothetical protein JW966_12875 [Anaerolineae bacterium]|nr:hypothetical protein [Anaerolineae bacterium]
MRQTLVEHKNTALAVAPASPQMAAKLAQNRTGRLTRDQRRVTLAAIVVLGVMLLCPLAMIAQFAALALTGMLPPATLFSLILTVCGIGFMLLMSALVFANLRTFWGDTLSAVTVRYARGPLKVHMSEHERVELPFSYIVDDYSFAPFVVPPDIVMRPGAPYIVYYAARSRILLSIAALDAPDSADWQPTFDNLP